jgi:hypothetical protein
MKTHLRYPIFWTACNMSARERLPSSIKMTADKSKVTCGSCKRTQGFFSRDDHPGDPVVERPVRRGRMG